MWQPPTGWRGPAQAPKAGGPDRVAWPQVLPRRLAPTRVVPQCVLPGRNLEGLAILIGCGMREGIGGRFQGADFSCCSFP